MRAWLRRGAEALDERANPILVKELYQGLRGRAFAVTGLLVLVGPLIVYLGMLVSGSDEDAGRAFLGIVLAFMGFATFLAIPFGSHRLLVAELQSRTLELIELTRLTPWQIVSGRFQAALAKSALIIALLAPFAASSIVIGATSAEAVLVPLLSLSVLAAVGASAALLLGSIARINVKLSQAASLGYVGSGLFLLSALGLAGARPFSFGGGEWEIAVWVAVLLLACTGFCLRLAADVLTVASARTYAPSKLALLGVLGLFVVPVVFDEQLLGQDLGEGGMVATACAGALCAALGVLWAAADGAGARSAALWPFPFRPQAEAHQLYCGLLIGGLAVAWIASAERPVDEPLAFYWGACFLLLLSVTELLWRAFPKRMRTSTLYLVVCAALVLGNGLVSASVLADLDWANKGQLHPLVVFLPFVVGDAWRDLTWSRWVFAAPFVAALLVAVVRRGLTPRVRPGEVAQPS